MSSNAFSTSSLRMSRVFPTTGCRVSQTPSFGTPLALASASRSGRKCFVTWTAAGLPSFSNVAPFLELQEVQEPQSPRV